LHYFESVSILLGKMFGPCLDEALTDMGVIRQNPEEIVDRVVEGLDMLSQGRERDNGVERRMGRQNGKENARVVGPGKKVRELPVRCK
jgi:hypothetical protein